MSEQSKNAYASVPFKFIVDGEPLYIHADLVSLHSKPLDRMINGHMAEAQKGFAVLDDVDKGTFVRFIEWAHRGYYTAAECTTVKIESSRTSRSPNTVEVVTAPERQYQFGWPAAVPEPEPEPDLNLSQPEIVSLPFHKKGKKGKKADNWECFGQQSRVDTGQQSKRELKEAFISRKYAVRQSAWEIPPPRHNQSPEEDYTQVFLSHARLYVFAEKYDIRTLKKLAVAELHATLAIYTVYLERTGDIVALLRYVYGNTGEPKKGAEKMRVLMTEYVGYEMDTLMNDEDFRDLMIEDGGPLLADFMTMVGRRIS